MEPRDSVPPEPATAGFAAGRHAGAIYQFLRTPVCPKPA
ncbi:MAG: hypothetical protein OJF49_001723 [Ktedonobacterales bacterium]|nr:MAG: hypothetical protein OJF49_001723 [Ktedonobacterales bacterium]